MATSLTPGLMAFVSNLVRGDEHRARDLVQDTFLAAWRSLPDLRDPLLLRAWIYRVAYRNAMSWIRRRGPRGRPIVALDPGLFDGVESRPVREGPLWHVAGDWADSAEMAPKLLARLAELPPRYEMPLRLHYFERMDLRETSRVLGVPIATVKMRLHRARALLRRHLVTDESSRRFRAGSKRHAPATGRRPPRPSGLRAPRPPPAPPTHVPPECPPLGLATGHCEAGGAS